MLKQERLLNSIVTGVLLEVLTTFNRLKQLNEDKNVIAEALKKSKSGLLQVQYFLKVSHTSVGISIFCKVNKNKVAGSKVIIVLLSLLASR